MSMRVRWGRNGPAALALLSVVAGCTPAGPGASAGAGVPAPTAVKAIRATAPAAFDVDDPAIWVNAVAPARSLIVGTVKLAAPDGALAVYALDGHVVQMLRGPDRPNNVDVEYGIDIDGSPTDIAVLTERLGRRLRAYAFAPDGSDLRDISAGTMQVLDGASGDEGAPMGIGLYKRPRDGAVFAVISPKAGPKDGYLWQYRLQDDGTGRVGATFVRRFGCFSGRGEIEAIAVDDELGYVYYADEDDSIHKWLADPDAPGADRELAVFGTTGYQQDREGIGIYTLPGGHGYIVSVDQLPGQSRLPRLPSGGGTRTATRPHTRVGHVHRGRRRHRRARCDVRLAAEFPEWARGRDEQS